MYTYKRYTFGMYTWMGFDKTVCVYIIIILYCTQIYAYTFF